MPAQKFPCSKCKQLKWDTRKYVQNGKTIRYCQSCSLGQNGLKVAIKQKVPQRFK